jgi:hypothetical protein
LELIPSALEAAVHSEITLSIRVSGLGAFEAPSIGAFDVNLEFDSMALTFVDVIYGDPVLGDQLDLFGLGSVTTTTVTNESVNLFQLSLDSPADIDALQHPSFELATVRFIVEALGTSEIALLNVDVADAVGEPLSVVTASASVTGTPVPEPATLTLLLTGVLGVRCLAKRRRV